MELEPGDMQLLNNYVVLHSRTDFEDHAEPERRRHLLRLWLSIPQSQPAAAQWETYFGDVRPNSVRGGVRGSELTSEYLDFEARQARTHGMLLSRNGAPAVSRVNQAAGGAGMSRRSGSTREQP
jgi:hypothetical protein